MRVLYISYDGLLEPLGQSQVLAYVERLAATHAITLLSYEKPQDLADDAGVAALRARLQAAGVGWIPRRYHRRPTLPATAWDVLVGLATGLRLRAAGQVDMVHARGYVAAMIGLCLKWWCGTRLLFDMRGFWADEKIDAGTWTRTGLAYRLTKWWERRFFEQADAMVSLTRAGLEAMPLLGYRTRPSTPVAVIPTCVDLERFTPGPGNASLRRRLGLEGRTVLGFVGNLSTWYLREAMLRYAARLMPRLERAALLIVTWEDAARLRVEARAAGVPDERLVIERAAFAGMPEYMRAIDLGIFFIKVCFSKKSSTATKLPEFLATGVPVVINDGIGDAGAIVRESRTGVVLPDLSDAAVEASLNAVPRLLADSEMPTRCRQAAQRWFSLEQGVAEYAALYRRLDRAPRGAARPSMPPLEADAGAVAQPSGRR